MAYINFIFLLKHMILAKYGATYSTKYETLKKIILFWTFSNFLLILA